MHFGHHVLLIRGESSPALSFFAALRLTVWRLLVRCTGALLLHDKHGAICEGAMETFGTMPKNIPRRRPRTRAEIARAHRYTTGGIVRDYLTVHFGPDHVVTHEVTPDGRHTFSVRNRTDRPPVHTLLVDLLVLEVHEGRLHKLAGLLSYLQVAHHLRKGGTTPLRINSRCELCEGRSGRVLALPPGHLAVYGSEPEARRA